MKADAKAQPEKFRTGRRNPTTDRISRTPARRDQAPQPKKGPQHKTGNEGAWSLLQALFLFGNEPTLLGFGEANQVNLATTDARVLPVR